MIALGNTNEASNLTYAIAAATDNRDTRGYAFILANADGRACYGTDMSKERGSVGQMIGAWV